MRTEETVSINKETLTPPGIRSNDMMIVQKQLGHMKSEIHQDVCS